MVIKTSPDPTGYGGVHCEARIQQHCLGDSDPQGGGGRGVPRISFPHWRGK